MKKEFKIGDDYFCTSFGVCDLYINESGYIRIDANDEYDSEEDLSLDEMREIRDFFDKSIKKIEKELDPIIPLPVGGHVNSFLEVDEEISLIFKYRGYRDHYLTGISFDFNKEKDCDINFDFNVDEFSGLMIEVYWSFENLCAGKGYYPKEIEHYYEGDETTEEIYNKELLKHYPEEFIALVSKYEKYILENYFKDGIRGR